MFNSRALLLQTDTLWFRDDGELTRVLCESGILKALNVFKIIYLITISINQTSQQKILKYLNAVRVVRPNIS